MTALHTRRENLEQTPTPRRDVEGPGGPAPGRSPAWGAGYAAQREAMRPETQSSYTGQQRALSPDSATKQTHESTLADATPTAEVQRAGGPTREAQPTTDLARTQGEAPGGTSEVGGILWYHEQHRGYVPLGKADVARLVQHLGGKLTRTDKARIWELYNAPHPHRFVAEDDFLQYIRESSRVVSKHDAKTLAQASAAVASWREELEMWRATRIAPLDTKSQRRMYAARKKLERLFWKYRANPKVVLAHAEAELVLADTKDFLRFVVGRDDELNALKKENPDATEAELEQGLEEGRTEQRKELQEDPLRRLCYFTQKGAGELDPQVWWLLAHMFEKQGDLHHAQRCFYQVSQTEGPQQDEAQLHCGRLMMARGQTLLAAKTLLELYGRNPAYGDRIGAFVPKATMEKLLASLDTSASQEADKLLQLTLLQAILPISQILKQLYVELQISAGFKAILLYWTLVFGPWAGAMGNLFGLANAGATICEAATDQKDTKKVLVEQLRAHGERFKEATVPISAGKLEQLEQAKHAADAEEVRQAEADVAKIVGVATATVNLGGAGIQGLGKLMTQTGVDGGDFAKFVGKAANGIGLAFDLIVGGMELGMLVGAIDDVAAAAAQISPIVAELSASTGSRKRTESLAEEFQKWPFFPVSIMPQGMRAPTASEVDSNLGVSLHRLNQLLADKKLANDLMALSGQ